jgi:hypothetical protein
VKTGLKYFEVHLLPNNKPQEGHLENSECLCLSLGECHPGDGIVIEIKYET